MNMCRPERVTFVVGIILVTGGVAVVYSCGDSLKHFLGFGRCVFPLRNVGSPEFQKNSRKNCTPLACTVRSDCCLQLSV
ncbi:hypothetical protein CEXT_609591 [Caerostris extrusa]|uniref:Secreted protein n=1 Tax=Caerostris extrusa TaxID=172846 RepID=A0AAV4XWC9_CAEEX|nr:hypothetical protein CEXT_609591 [Caerostris extrusa]